MAFGSRSVESWSAVKPRGRGVCCHGTRRSRSETGCYAAYPAPLRWLQESRPRAPTWRLCRLRSTRRPPGSSRPRCLPEKTRFDLAAIQRELLPELGADRELPVVRIAAVDRRAWRQIYRPLLRHPVGPQRVLRCERSVAGSEGSRIREAQRQAIQIRGRTRRLRHLPRDGHTERCAGGDEHLWTTHGELRLRLACASTQDRRTSENREPKTETETEYRKPNTENREPELALGWVDRVRHAVAHGLQRLRYANRDSCPRRSDCRYMVRHRRQDRRGPCPRGGPVRIAVRNISAVHLPSPVSVSGVRLAVS